MKREFQQTIKYHEEKPAVELTLTEADEAPGLCVGPNPAHADWKSRPKFAVFHKPSGSIVRAVKRLRDAWELVARIAPLTDWNRPVESIPWAELSPAHKIAREYGESTGSESGRL